MQHLSIRERFARGRLIGSPDSVKLLFDVVNAPAGIRKIRVKAEHFPRDIEIPSLRPSAVLDIFLLAPTEHDPSMWYGHAGWAEAGGARNPWLHNPPQMGDVVRGTVSSYVHDYAVVVSLDGSGIEAFLHRDYLPDPLEGRAPSTPITKQLFLGDRIEAVVIESQPTQLHLKLSVNERLRHVREAPDTRAAVDAIAFPPDKAIAAQSRPNSGVLRRLILVEDDDLLAASVHSLASKEGWRCDRARNEESTRQLLRDGRKYDVILLDYHLAVEGQRAKCEKLLAGQRVGLMSGDHAAAEHARKHGYSWLPKPLDWEPLREFIEGKDFPPTLVSIWESTVGWGSGAAMSRAIERQRSLLQRLRNYLHADAVLWLLRERKDVYRPAGTAGFPDDIQTQLDEMEPFWTQTLVADAHANPEQPQTCPVSSSGALQRISPTTSGQVLAVAADIPGSTEGKGGSILVFFRREIWRESDQAHLDFARWSAEDLAERLDLAQRLEDQEAFATEGRMTAGLIHEIAHALSPLVAALQDLDGHLRRGGQDEKNTGQELRGLMALALSQAKRTSWLAKNSLAAIRNERPPIFRVPDDLENLSKILAFVAGKRDIRLLHNFSGLPNITLNLPPAVVEQALINLLDNALYHLHGRKWGRIAISATWEEGQALPLAIHVADTGLGMTAKMRGHLFEPRRSSRGRTGFGMGLYVTRNLLESVGGSLECVESLRWLGSRFRLRLPCRLAEKEA